MTEAYAPDLAEDTAFERLFLATAFPLEDPHATAISGTYRPLEDRMEMRVSLHEVLGTTAASAVSFLKIQPLGFGAAWKIFDLMMEHAFSAAGRSPSQGKRWLIKEKVGLAHQGIGEAAPLTLDRPSWEAIGRLYVATEQVRHSLVHRTVDQRPDGSIVGVDAKGQPLPPLTLKQQESCCFAAQRAASAVIDGTISQRHLADFRWHLDQLVGLHGGPSLAGRRLSDIRSLEVVVEPSSDGSFEINGTALKARLRATGDPNLWIDVSFVAQGNPEPLLTSELDEIPDGSILVNPLHAPPW